MFEQKGYFKEFYLDRKFIGTVFCEKDRDKIGFLGRQIEVLETDIKCDNGKRIKAGSEVTTILYPFNTKKLA